jgi:CheY-like chemotaxis protein
MNIKGGKSQIHRIISNLATHAIDAMKPGGTLSIKTENFYADEVTGKFGRIPRGEYVKVTVSDTGNGIPRDILSKIWDPFFTTKIADKKRGSGLGLSVVHAVVEDHHGFIDLSSELEKCTNFYLYFPITREVRELEEREQLVGGTEKILVVDDDSVQLEVSNSLLSNLGYDVLTINSGEKALDILREETIDLLVLDMVMPPGMDGAETYRRALEINPNQKAIIISGYAETERVDYAKKLGIGSYIRKPLTLRAIASVVRKELDKNAVPLNNLETVRL